MAPSDVQELDHQQKNTYSSPFLSGSVADDDENGADADADADAGAGDTPCYP